MWVRVGEEGEEWEEREGGRGETGQIQESEHTLVMASITFSPSSVSIMFRISLSDLPRPTLNTCLTL